ncbi:MAG: histidine phosphatase family protein [Muribaculaceae bacterium]|nr:histidine phosphatase family protein [Muribaculaceae bacterium]
MQIYLMRHGETDWNKARRLQGQSDIPLNEYGRELAVKTAEALADVSFDMAFCSPLGRAQETARIILGDRKTPLYTDARLKEINFGTNEGICFDAAKRNPEDPLHDFFCKPDLYVPPEGAESFAQVAERGHGFLQEKVLPLEGKCDTLLIVAHGAFNRSLLNAVLGTPLKDFWRISLPNCAVSILSLEAGLLKVVEESRVYYGDPVNGRP